MVRGDRGVQCRLGVGHRDVERGDASLSVVDRALRLVCLLLAGVFGLRVGREGGRVRALVGLPCVWQGALRGSDLGLRLALLGDEGVVGVGGGLDRAVLRDDFGHVELWHYFCSLFLRVL